MNGCAGSKQAASVPQQKAPRNIVVLPVANESLDLTAPILIRYFLEREVADKNYLLVFGSQELDQNLRQMGITNGNQIGMHNYQHIGQSLKAEGVFHATLLKFDQHPTRDQTVIRARFRLVETQTGRTVWQSEKEIEGEGRGKVPIRVAVNLEWTSGQTRAVARSRAGKLPKKLVRQGLKTLPPGH